MAIARGLHCRAAACRRGCRGAFSPSGSLPSPPLCGRRSCCCQRRRSLRPMPPIAAMCCCCRPATTSSAAPIAVAASFLALVLLPPRLARPSCGDALAGCSACDERARPLTSLAAFLVLARPDRSRLRRQPRSAVQPAAAHRLDAALGRPDARAGNSGKSLGMDQSVVRAVLARATSRLAAALAAASQTGRLLAGASSSLPASPGSS